MLKKIVAMALLFGIIFGNAYAGGLPQPSEEKMTYLEFQEKSSDLCDRVLEPDYGKRYSKRIEDSIQDYTFDELRSLIKQLDTLRNDIVDDSYFNYFDDIDDIRYYNQLNIDKDIYTELKIMLQKEYPNPYRDHDILIAESCYPYTAPGYYGHGNYLIFKSKRSYETYNTISGIRYFLHTYQNKKFYSYENFGGLEYEVILYSTDGIELHRQTYTHSANSYQDDIIFGDYGIKGIDLRVEMKEFEKMSFIDIFGKSIFKEVTGYHKIKNAKYQDDAECREQALENLFGSIYEATSASSSVTTVDTIECELLHHTTDMEFGLQINFLEKK